MAKSPSIRSLLKDLEPNELREVIAELCKLTPKNRKFVELFLTSSSVADIEPLVAEAKKKIYGCFYETHLEIIDLRGARKVISEYSKLLKDYPFYITELRLYYVEVGTDLTATYGDIYESFYDSLISMIEKVCSDIEKHPEWYEKFSERFKKLYNVAYNFGWGYGDFLEETVEKLEKRFGAGTA